MIERVLVTGASRGIGRAVVEALLADGRRVAAVARDRRRLETLEGAHAVSRDLSDPGGVVAEAVAALGGVDGLVHAAGIAEHAPLEAISVSAVDRAHALHVRAPLVLAQDLAAHLRGQGRPGSIVMVTSTLASRPAPTTLAYAASKAALTTLTRGLALELAADGIRVNAVAPGVVDTDMVRALRLAPGEEAPVGEARVQRLEQQLATLRDLHPLGRLGTPVEVAAAILHALDAGWMTGSVVTLDGGLTLR